MKSVSLVFLVMIFILILSTNNSFSQLPWTKDPNNPVLSGGSSGGAWNRYLFWPGVLYNTDSSRYEMWYSGTNGTPFRPMQIGFATSDDGVNWTKEGPAVLTPGTAGSWDDSSVEGVWVVLEDSIYKMWYSGWNASNQEWSIGYATSPDAITWTKHPNPVMTQGPAAWEAGGITVGTVLYNEDSTRYEMWYTGFTTGSVGNIGYAISPDGINWTKDTLNNPVLTNGGSGTWDEDVIEIPRVIYINNMYHMWFAGIPDSYNDPWQIGWATSDDGIHWNRYNDPSTTSAFYSESDPVLSPDNNQWDGSRLQSGTVIRIGDSLHLWYTGVLSPVPTNLWRIGHATAPITLNVPVDYPTIQAAIDAAVDGNVVLVADGIYQENINFKGKAITVASHFYMDGDTSHISNTIIDGSNPSNPDSGSVVSFVSGEDTTTVLYGFTIAGGSGTITEYDFGGSTYPIRSGGGIFCYNSGASILYNKIMNNMIPNYVESSGGGISGYPNGSTSNILIEGNQIENNNITGSVSFGSALDINCNSTLINNKICSNISSATGAAWGAVSFWSESSAIRNVLLKNNNITKNQSFGSDAFGGGLAIGSGIIAEVIINTISDNELNCTGTGRGAGIYVSSANNTNTFNRNLILNNKIIGGNISTGGGVCFNLFSNSIITNNIICDNSSLEGGGIYSRNCDLQITNNTIVNNSATVGGGIRASISQHIIINSILWGNSAASGPQIAGDPTPIIRYSNIQGGFTGHNNLNIDPLFVPGDTLYNLSDSSHCIGTGTDSLYPPFDFDGDPRPMPANSTPDIGAQENPLADPTGGIFVIDSKIPKTYNLKQNYPNPFNPITTIGFSVPNAEFVTLKIYNLLGQVVDNLVSSDLKPGEYKYTWDASLLANGIYYYKLQSGKFKETKKMILLK